jgi:hypothetical protein
LKGATIIATTGTIFLLLKLNTPAKCRNVKLII